MVLLTLSDAIDDEHKVDKSEENDIEFVEAGEDAADGSP
jgi:hypothetical protein